MKGNVRLVVVVGAALVMAGAWAFKGWQLEKNALEACDNMIRGYQAVVAEQGNDAVDPMRFVLRARPYREYGGRC